MLLHDVVFLPLSSQLHFLYKKLFGGPGQEVAYLFQSRFHKYQNLKGEVAFHLLQGSLLRQVKMALPSSVL